MNHRQEYEHTATSVRTRKDGPPLFIRNNNMTPKLGDIYDAIIALGGTNKHVSLVHQAMQPILCLMDHASFVTRGEYVFTELSWVQDTLSYSELQKLSTYGATRINLSREEWSQVTSEVKHQKPHIYHRDIFMVSPALWEKIDIHRLHVTTPHQFFALRRRLGVPEPIELSSLPNALISIYKQEFAQFSNVYGALVPRPSARTVVFAAVKSMAIAAQEKQSSTRARR